MSATVEERPGTDLNSDNRMDETIAYEPNSPSETGADDPMGSSDMPKANPTSQAQGRYTFGSGARPLDGYTIKRAIGRGGFGEVYYGTSDSGKEVALKLILRNLDVERRGVMQCMNLKCPNLLTIFDMKTSDAGDSFVVMEYVAGPSLASVLKQYPGRAAAGRGPPLAQRAGRGSRLPPRPRDRPPRPQAGQSVHGRRDRQDRRLRPGQAHHAQPGHRPFREHRHLPLHGSGDSVRASTTSRSTSTRSASSSTRCSPAGCRSTARPSTKS